MNSEIIQNLSLSDYEEYEDRMAEMVDSYFDFPTSTEECHEEHSD